MDSKRQRIEEKSAIIAFYDQRIKKIEIEIKKIQQKLKPLNNYQFFKKFKNYSSEDHILRFNSQKLLKQKVCFIKIIKKLRLNILKKYNQLNTF